MIAIDGSLVVTYWCRGSARPAVRLPSLIWICRVAMRCVAYLVGVGAVAYFCEGHPRGTRVSRSQIEQARVNYVGKSFSPASRFGYGQSESTLVLVACQCRFVPHSSVCLTEEFVGMAVRGCGVGHERTVILFSRFLR